MISNSSNGIYECVRETQSGNEFASIEIRNWAN